MFFRGYENCQFLFFKSMDFMLDGCVLSTLFYLLAPFQLPGNLGLAKSMTLACRM